MASTAASSTAGGSVAGGALLQLTTKTALWVGRLKRERPREEVARVLAFVGHANQGLMPVMESHFRCFCSSAAPDNGGEELAAIWQAAVENTTGAVMQSAKGEEEDPLDVLRQMFWNDNPDDQMLETKTYEHVKRYIEYEKGFWKCGIPVGYGRVDDKTGEIHLLCQSKMRDVLQDVHYAQVASSDNGGRRVELTCACARWMADDTKRRYDRIVVDPTMKHAATEYNLWSGFAAEKEPPIAVDLVHDYVLPILEHIRLVLADGVERDYNYIVDWMSFLVQKPERRTQTLLLFYGQQGAGKGVVWDFIRQHVLGARVSMQTANPKHDLFERFANGFLYKRLVQLDEAQDIRQYEDDIKNKLTSDTLRYEKKNQDPITIDNFANFVVTTNNLVTLRVAHDDRRLVFFRCSDHRRNDKDYFTDLCTSMARPGAGRAMYQFFMERDLTAYNNNMAFQKLRPITPFYREMRADSLKPEILFFSALVNAFSETTGVLRFHISDLYAAYKAFATEMLETNAGHRLLHCTSFGRQLNKLVVGAAAAKNKGHKVYPIHMRELADLLKRANMFDEDAVLNSNVPKPHL